MPAIAKAHKEVARAARSAFGGQPKVVRYWDESRKSSVDVLSCADSPYAGVTSYATVGLSDVRLTRNGQDIGVRTEFVAACDSEEISFAACLATAAFYVIKSGMFVAPGVIFPDVLRNQGVSSTMRDFLFLPPFLWEGRLKSLTLGERKVAWLLAVPIAAAESLFAEAKGVPALEELFEKKQIDIFDLERPSVVPVLV